MRGLKLIVLFLLVTANSTSYAGGSSVNNGGDWFVRSLPLLKIQLPEDFGVVEGVQYKRVGLRKCEQADTSKLSNSSNIPDKINVIYLPDRNWNAFRVLIENGKTLLCSLGLADSNPATSLQTLTNNEDTNRILYAVYPEVGRQIKYSKSSGTLSQFPYTDPAIGTFLINLDPRGIYVGYNLQDGIRVLGFPRSIYFTPESNPQDDVYISLSIQDRDRVYFVQTVIDNSQNPVWRIVLPVALKTEDLPLAPLAKALRDNTDGTAWKAFYGIKFDPFTDSQVTKNTAWTSFSTTQTSQRLRKELVLKFGVSQLGAMSSPDYLMPLFQVSFLPSILDGELNHPAFRHGERGGEILIPIVSQTWRIGADVVHELTHALQGPCGPGCTDDRLFQMEMEAHTNERQHLKEMVEMQPLTKYADDAFNFLVAASLPNIEWATSYQAPIKRDLCEDVILGYKLDIGKIRASTLSQFNCQLHSKTLKLASRRIR